MLLMSSQSTESSIRKLVRNPKYHYGHNDNDVFLRTVRGNCYHTHQLEYKSLYRIDRTASRHCIERGEAPRIYATSIASTRFIQSRP